MVRFRNERFSGVLLIQQIDHFFSAIRLIQRFFLQELSDYLEYKFVIYRQLCEKRKGFSRS